MAPRPRNQAAGERLYPDNRPTTDTELLPDDGLPLDEQPEWNYDEVAKRGEREPDSSDE